MSKGLQGLTSLVGPDFGLEGLMSVLSFPAGRCFGLGEVEADGVLELEKCYRLIAVTLIMVISNTLWIYLGRDKGRIEGEGTEELGFISSPSSPGSKVTTEQNPSELEKRYSVINYNTLNYLEEIS